MPNNISNELYLECYCDEQWFSYEMVNLGEDAESIYAIVGAISYETILNNRGIDNKTIDDCNLTLNGEGPITWGKDLTEHMIFILLKQELISEHFLQIIISFSFR